jgi:hypothetical protein
MNRRVPERGSVMLVTLIIISALLAGSAVLVSMQLASTRNSDSTKTGMSALYCAEAGLSAARAAVAAGYPSWNTSLCNPSPRSAIDTCFQPTWLSNTAFSHDLDGDGIDDFRISLVDDDDDAVYTTDNNLRIYVVSQCIKYPDNPRIVEELVSYTPTANCYRAQQGGCNGRGNGN